MSVVIQIDNYAGITVHMKDHEVELCYVPICKECGGKMWQSGKEYGKTVRETYRCRECERAITVKENRLVKVILLEKKI